MTSPLGQLPLIRISDNACECTDPGCPACQGLCGDLDAINIGQPAAVHLFRIDQEDRGGTFFCGPCGEDAAASGVFVDDRDDFDGPYDTLAEKYSD